MNDLATHHHEQALTPHTGQPRSIHRSRRRTILAIAVLTVAALAVSVTGMTGLYGAHLTRTFDNETTRIDHAFPDETARPPATTDGSQNILLMGSDSRESAAIVGAEAPTNQRTDSMMLLHIDADRQSVSVMSIMRDLWVPIPGHGEAKLNAAFAYGGSALTVQTIENLLAVRIDHVAIIDFEGFKYVTTALGGVEVVSDRAFRSTAIDRDAAHDYVQGVNHLDGAEALAFVRERHAFTDADFQRVKNQQAFLRGVLDTLISRDTLTDPFRVSAVVAALAPYLSMDESLDAQSIVSLAVSLRDIRPDDLQFFTLPTAGTATRAGQSVVELDTAALPAVQAALQSDDLESFLTNRAS